MAVLKILNEAGKYYDNEALNDVIEYCTRGNKTRQKYIGSYAIANTMTAIQEMEILCKLAGKNKGVRLRHFTIGFSPELNLNSDTVFEIAGKCAVYYGDSYQIIYAVHTDTEHLHIHFVMNMLSYRTGKKYQGKKKDLYDFIGHCNRVFKDAEMPDSLEHVKDKEEKSI